jgi:predicted metalloprotease with PDZ domain
MLKWDDVTRIATRLKGVPVLGCRPGSPAARAGVQYGDVLVAVNGLPTPDWGSYIEARALGAGEMRVELFRAGQTLTFEFVLPQSSEPIDPAALLEELIENGLMPLPTPDPRREPEPS